MAADRPTTGTRVEGLVLVLILIAVAGFAGAASFTHVKDWTLANSPTGTGEWFGWANAVISELVPIASLLTIRRRRRIGAPIGYPLFLLIAAAGLSLSAQLAVAKPGPSGWLLSAVPALAFMALVKLVLAPAPMREDTPPAEPAEPIRVEVAEQVTTEPAPPAAITPAPAVEPEPVTVPASEPVDVPTHLLPMARFAAVQHEQSTGQPITPTELADRLDVAPAVAGQLLTTLTGGAR
ncbi:MULTISPECIES: hypothetical protein [Micromonospora]|uniref:DUF2637 domain-containing protein n=1 Tax=Micromonospora solifontis TaxID=2487138 RepID=A0ABX9WND6_9ACTN|nr:MULTISPECIES: hypothetical protein [Micromonospora]NES13277.1 hypothetical protein [Micromonospora sp. PPF5-17B]NES34646.1 hypothetical protein [Micromonospora solifontis]NES57162.1 hypothetical protein [Micromonospora sp. PPF5-6]RNM01889.1 hypothetical protein EFE23_00475 [Micromonospora solifontis]